MAIVTKQSIQLMLENKNHEYVKTVIGRALVVLFNNQTSSEQLCDNTMVNNGIGFTGADAHSGSLSAKYYLKRKNLQEWQMNMWLKKNSKGFSRLAKYHSQLNAAASSKRTK